MMKNNHEIIFTYDVTDCNPNGDPNNENSPRVDEETGHIYVTDVRLKRTIRDYLYNPDVVGRDIYCIQTTDENGKLNTASNRYTKYFDNEEEFVASCIDVRLFGGVVPERKGNGIQLTGAVQFNYGRSIHKPTVNVIQGTGAFASSEGKGQQTFRSDQFTHYALIQFNGRLDKNLASKVNLSNDDYDAFIDAMWEGTKRLQSRSKTGHMSRILIDVEYKDDFFIGELHKLIKYNLSKDDYEIRDIDEIEVDFRYFSKVIEAHKDKIEKINIKLNPRVKYINLDIDEELLRG